jgi:membrane-associated protein
MWEFLTKLTDPHSIIEHGGLWLLLLVIFAETGLLVGFFLPGDNLILLAGIICRIKPGLLNVDYPVMVTLMIAAAVIGNACGYWFGKKAGQRLYARKDSLLFKQEHVEVTKHYYAKYGGNMTLVIARFLPVIRTFAPVIAGVIGVEFLSFMAFNIIGATAWIVSLTAIGYFIVQIFPGITEHMSWIFFALIVLTSIPILRVLFRRKSPKLKT